MFDPTPEQISRIWGANLQNVQTHWPIIKAALEAKGVKYAGEFIGALATIGVEVPWFKPVHELGKKERFMHMYDCTSSDPRGKRRARVLGNDKPGDGYTYRGRGFIQLTGKANYRSHSEVVGIDLVENPEAAVDPHNAAIIFAHYFTTHGVNVWSQKAFKAISPPCEFCPGNGLLGGKRPLVKHATCSECAWKTARRKVNGGLNHYKEFRQYARKLCELVAA